MNFCLLHSGLAQAQQNSIDLGLKEAVKMALERNLDIQAELYNPASAEAVVIKSKSIYNPFLSLFVGYQDLNVQQSFFIDSQSSVDRQKNAIYNAEISQLLPGGGTISASFNNNWDQNNLDAFGISNMDVYFRSKVGLSLSQPLLKNFGSETTELRISVAKFDKEGSIEQLRTKLLDIVSQVMTQYNKLYSLHKNLEVKRTSLNLAETILNNTRDQVTAGVLPPIEILNAQFGVAAQRKNYIDAERALRDQIGVLRVLLQLHGITDIIPTDAPIRDEYKVDESQEIQRGLTQRPDLRQMKISLKSSELQSRVAKTQILPELNAIASAAFTGLADNYNRDLERVGSGQYPIWFVGLRLTYPIGNDSARNDYIKSKLRTEQIKTQIKELEESVSNDVSTAVRAVSSGFLQLDVTAQGRSYAEEVLQAYIEKQKAGLATTKDVLDELNNLVVAQGNEIQAVTDYNNAIVTLMKTTGELLERQNVTITDKDTDYLYDKSKQSIAF